MTSGEFTIGLITIITGLAISDMVISLHALLMHRRRVTWDWLAMLTAMYVFLLIVATWGINFRDIGNQEINPPLWLFGLRLAQAIAIYLAARASLPDAIGQKGVRLADHYAEISRYFWVAMVVTYILYLGFELAQYGLSAISGPFLVAAFQLLLMVPLIASSARSIHRLAVPAIFALFCYDHLLTPMFA